MTHKKLLEQVLEVVQQYLPPDGIDAKEAMYRIVGLVDPMPEEKTLEQHRAGFEQWAAKEGFRMTKRGDGQYVAPFTSIAWRAWQEAVKQNAE